MRIETGAMCSEELERHIRRSRSGKIGQDVAERLATQKDAAAMKPRERERREGLCDAREIERRLDRGAWYIGLPRKPSGDARSEAPRAIEPDRACHGRARRRAMSSDDELGHGREIDEAFVNRPAGRLAAE
jgi:hypothetical protein